ncbi:trypsin-like peptidase domain-containing protein [Dactylosporangium siamense]|uniref:Trypsin-like serine protease n=1 Tax=Dactylosporangium siamense TaxID=685454 RepID=A0A919PJY9_9ACTN|nr:trypsin-like peptidase domain-containing protein [Dactylosporangium siamense]GIG46141.1 hypothetical protein Dsi01nite_041820 [Dactylosporangium siamense]
MSEQQGWAPDPADQQGRASSPAAQPTTTPADSTPAEQPATAPVTPPGTAPAAASVDPAAELVTTSETTQPAAASVDPAAQPVTTSETTPAAQSAAASVDPAAHLDTTSDMQAAGTAAPATPLAALPAMQPATPQFVTPTTAVPAVAMPPATTPAEPAWHEAPHAWPTNPSASAAGARTADQRAEPSATWPTAQHATPAAGDAGPAARHGMAATQDFRGAAEGSGQTWPASQHTAPQPGPLHAAGQPGTHAATGQPGPLHPAGQPGNLHAAGQPGTHAAAGQPGPLHPAGQAGPLHPAGQPGNLHAAGPSGMHAAGTGGHDPRAWAAAAGAGQDQPHLPTAQLPPHVPHMQRPPQWAPQPQPGSVFVTPAVRRRSRVGLAVAAIVAAVGLSAVSAFGGGLAALELRPDKSNTVVSATNSSGSAAGATTTLSDVAARVLPSVVSISTGNAVGSGVVITDDGAILTNNHVVATARGTTVQVTFSNGQSVQAKIVGTEPTSDLAVIKIVGGGTYTPLAFGDSSTVKVGDTVLAVGSPLGLDGSVTAGIVSAVNRTIDEGEDGQSAAANITGAIQTDAAINPGNSGGALVNTAGQLVGINTAIATSGNTAGNIGVGFAISSNTAKTVAQRLLS